MAESTARGYLGSGDLYINLFESGAFSGYVGPIECNAFSITPASELRELISKSRANYGQPVESVTLPQPFELSVGVSQVDRTTLTLALFGTQSPITPQASGTLTNEAVTVTKLNTWIPLSKAALTGPITVTDDSGTPVTLINGEDYIVNMELGWIKALPGGAIAVTDEISVSGAYGAIAGTRIRGATNSTIRARFQLHGTNFVDGADVIVTVHDARISSDEAWDMLADDFATITLNGRMTVPQGFTEPFTVDLRDPT